MSDSDEGKGILEETKKALTKDAEVPIDKKLPGSTFALVALSYMALLAIGALVLAAVLWASGVWSETESPQSPQTPPGIVMLVPE
jgi:hypothetical protein